MEISCHDLCQEVITTAGTQTALDPWIIPPTFTESTAICRWHPVVYRISLFPSNYTFGLSNLTSCTDALHVYLFSSV